MKKNLITVIILALVAANLILTAILTFTILPQTKKSNALIDQVCTAINLDLEGGQNKELAAIPIEDISIYDIGDKFTVNLADDGSGATDYAVFSVGLSVNTKSEVFKTYAKDETLSGITEKETLIKDTINTVVSNYTLDAFNANGYKDVKDAILTEMQAMFGNSSDFIVGINFSGVNTERRQ